jgi:cytochrome c556
MKKIITTLLMLCALSTSSYAAEQQERISDMKHMADGMELIMNGLLYNYLDNINAGSKYIQEGVENIRKKGDLKTYLPEDTAYAHKFGEKSLRRIMEYSNELNEAMKAKDFDAALESASLLMRQCNSCHARVRGW